MCCSQGFNQDLETGCLKLAIVKFWGVQIYKFTIYSDFNHKHVKSYQNKAWYPYTMSWELYDNEKKFNHMLEIDILRNSSQNFLGVLWGVFQGFGCQIETQMPCWLRPWL